MGLRKFTKDVIKEGKRVRWPKADVLVPSIVVVIVISFLIGLVLFGEDLLGQKLIEILSNNAK
ncbi:MAG: preprotein translocase subunit SecE [Bacilli bacterium]|nr:preprotein translocase subunit SecE [Bacilli bacterium]